MSPIKADSNEDFPAPTSPTIDISSPFLT